VRRYFTLTARSRDGLIIFGCILAAGWLLLNGHANSGRLGFPLDDAYIFQVYARNLAATGQWAFVPGVPSSGSTSVLWTLLIVPAYLLGINGIWWAFGLGLISLAAAALGTARLFDDMTLPVSLAIGLCMALEWHLVWAAVSGMETILFAALLTWFWKWFRSPIQVGSMHPWRTGSSLGLWTAALTLARPEGVLAAGLAGLVLILRAADWRQRLQMVGAAAATSSILIIPFFAVNVSASGTIWPNTFYAKQTEYAILWQDPYPLRLINQLWQPWIGAQLLLLPAIALDLISRVRRRTFEWISLIPWLWVIAHPAIYAARLPVTYQHGRYAMAVIPVGVSFGTHALVNLVRPRSRHLLIRVGSLVWAATPLVLFPAWLVILGAPAYARDVGYIDNEMVATANWINTNTAQSDRIALHDIGALGYYSPRPLIDLAGLVSPTVIPFMTNPDRLESFVHQQGAEYLVVFPGPGWPPYDRLVSRPGFCKVWSADERAGYTPYNPELGPLTIYRVSDNKVCP